MLTNYIKVTLRNIARSRVYSFINVFGLALGITCFILACLFVQDETGFDSFNIKADRIYRLYTKSNIGGEQSVNSKTAGPLGKTLVNDCPEVETYTRVGYFGQYHLRYQDKIFTEYHIYTADSTYFSVFSLPLISGDPKKALVNPNSIVVTETAAKRYFGDENPVGKYFTTDDNKSYLITGLMKDFPRKSHFSCDFLVSASTYKQMEANDWLNSHYTTYIVVKKGTDLTALQAKFDKIVMNFVGPQVQKVLGVPLADFFAKGNSYGYKLQPLQSIYLYSSSEYGIDKNTEWGDVKMSSIFYSYMFIAVASFILLIAIFNFMNLSTARSEKRAKEVGIRKTLGSDRKNLISQFIVESILTAFFSVVLAIVMSKLFMPFLNDFLNRNMNLDLLSSVFVIPALLLLTVLVGFLAGSYPAFYLSLFQPAQILKTNKVTRKSGLRSLLVIIQFAITIVLIISTIITRNQLEYIMNKDLGFEKEHLLIMSTSTTFEKKIKVFRQEIEANPEVISSTASSLIFTTGIPGNGYVFNNDRSGDIVSCQLIDTDFDFLDTYGLKIKQGRFFSKDFATDSNAVLINEAAMMDFKTTDPVGKDLEKLNANAGNLERFRIIGVVSNFNYESLHQKIRPLVFHLKPVQQASTAITIKINSADVTSTVNFLKDKWNEVTGGEYFNLRFLDDNLKRLYENEERIEMIITIFSFLAVIIACLGLFGLISFLTEQKTKEIGIRKVLGASVAEIIFMLSREILKWVTIANIIAWPIAYYLMHSWLQNFAYRTNIGWIVFAVSGITTIIISILTIGFQAVKAAVANPVESLRYE